jgi:hypothetical protein
MLVVQQLFNISDEGASSFLAVTVPKDNTMAVVQGSHNHMPMLTHLLRLTILAKFVNRVTGGGQPLAAVAPNDRGDWAATIAMAAALYAGLCSDAEQRTAKHSRTPRSRHQNG